jgi:DNA invertase Pin-like site-specific DNA recombinase/predicted  nucleic acid-binding Zn-ribbon protein
MENTGNPTTDFGALFAPKVAISYLRVSRLQQAQRGGGDDEGYSLPAQREANKKKAASMGAIIIKEFVDRGLSAKAANRKDLQDMLTFIREYDGKIDYVIVHKVDRLARNREDDTDITRILRQHNIRLVSTMESIDETPSGMLLHGIMASIAEFYSRNLATEVLKGMTTKAKGGGTVSKAPVGYINVRKIDELGREYRTVELDNERATFVRQAFELYATGEWTINDLAEHLAAHGFTTRGTPNIPSKPIDRRSLNAVLTNQYYTGKICFQNAYLPGKHEPLVDMETWQKVQDVLASHLCGERTRQHPHFLKSTVYCGSCGERLLIQYAKSGSGVRYPYFSCAGRHGKRNDCKQKSVLIEEVERQIAALYQTLSFTPEAREWLENWLTDEIQKTADKFAAQRQDLEREKDKHERKQRKLLEAHYADAIPLNLFKEEQGKIADAIAAIDSQLSLHDTKFGEVKRKLDKALAILENCGEMYTSAPEHMKRAFNQALFEKIYICPEDDGTCAVKPKFAEPYGLILGQKNQTEAGGDEAGLEKENSANLRGISELTRWFAEWRNRRIFLGGGFSMNLMVENSGIEPLTS